MNMELITWKNDETAYVAGKVQEMVLNFKQKRPKWIDTDTMEVVLNKYKNLIIYNAFDQERKTQAPSIIY